MIRERTEAQRRTERVSRNQMEGLRPANTFMRLLIKPQLSHRKVANYQRQKVISPSDGLLAVYSRVVFVFLVNKLLYFSGQLVVGQMEGEQPHSCSMIAV